MRYNRDKRTQSGFTLIELMIAATVFSTVLIVVSTGIIQIGRLYYKGITSSKTQEVARAVMEEVSRSIQFSKDQVVPPAPVESSNEAETRELCVGNTRYSFKLGQQIKNGVNDHAIWQDESDECSQLNIDNLAPNAPGRELLSENMRLLQLSVSPINNNLYRVKVKVAYGDGDLIDVYEETDPNIRSAIALEDGQCRSGIAGSHFCSVSVLETIVKKR